jgi:hypothetical protein
MITTQEEYIKEEQKNLKRELLRAQEEVKRIQSVPLVIGQFLEMIDANTGIVGSTTGSNYHVRILSTLNRELLKPSASVALHRHSNALVDVLPPEADSSISLLGDNERPDVTYQVCTNPPENLCACMITMLVSQSLALLGWCSGCVSVPGSLCLVIGVNGPGSSKTCGSLMRLAGLPCVTAGNAAYWHAAWVTGGRASCSCCNRLPQLHLFTVNNKQCPVLPPSDMPHPTLAGHRWLRHPEAGDQGGCGAATGAGRPVQADRHRPAPWRAAVRPARHRQDHAGQGGGTPHHSGLHQGGGLGVCAEVPRRGGWLCGCAAEHAAGHAVSHALCAGCCCWTTAVACCCLQHIVSLAGLSKISGSWHHATGYSPLQAGCVARCRTPRCESPSHHRQPRAQPACVQIAHSPC